MVLLDIRGEWHLKRTPLLYINEARKRVDLNAYMQLYIVPFKDSCGVLKVISLLLWIDVRVLLLRLDRTLRKET
jgi:hypothetical protein